jgi:hypothetical protein
MSDSIFGGFPVAGQLTLISFGNELPYLYTPVDNHVDSFGTVLHVAD